MEVPVTLPFNRGRLGREWCCGDGAETVLADDVPAALSSEFGRQEVINQSIHSCCSVEENWKRREVLLAV